MAVPTCQRCGAQLDASAMRLGRCSACGNALPNPSEQGHSPNTAGSPTAPIEATQVLGAVPNEPKTIVAKEGAAPVPAAGKEPVMVPDVEEGDADTTRMAGSPPVRSTKPADDAADERQMHPAERLVSSINQSRDSLTAFAATMQDITVKVALVCILIILAGWFYLTRPIAAAAPPPAGVATMISQTSATNPSADISVFIAALQRIDLERIGMINTLGQAMTGQPGTNAALAQDAQGIVRDYLAIKAPQAGTNLSNDYFQLLQDQTAMVTKASQYLATGDVKDAQAAHDAAMPQITGDAQTSDQALQQLCDSQQTNKPFDIVAEPQTSPAPSAETPSAPTPASTQSPAASASPAASSGAAQPAGNTPQSPSAQGQPSSPAQNAAQPAGASTDGSAQPASQ